MTIASNTYTTYSVIGIREQLDEMISNISPTDVPFQNMCGKTTIENTLFEWQKDSLRAAVSTNAQLEGDNAPTYTAATPTVRLKNYCQIARALGIVSGTADAVTKAGRKSEVAYQIVKLTKEVRRDMETSLTENLVSAAGNTTTARTTGGLRAWIATNDDMGATGSSGGFNGSTGIVDAATNGTQRALTETLLKSVLRSCWTAGGEPTTAMSGPFNKQVISGFTGNSTRMQDTSDQRLVASIDVYRHDYGTIRVVPNRFQPERNLYILQPNMWSVGFLRPIKRLDIGRTGDADPIWIQGEFGLKSRNEAASGVVADLTTS